MYTLGPPPIQHNRFHTYTKNIPSLQEKYEDINQVLKYILKKILLNNFPK